MRVLAKAAVFAMLACLGLPAFSSAQGLGTIAGVVRDSSGLALPGVSVEVASPALIEKTRTAVTDGSGQYSIVSLPVGTYSVTFTLTGFNASKREGVDLLANFTAPVNGELKVGSISETVTVTAQSPLIDVQSAAQTRAVTPELIKSVPIGGTMYQLAAMMPGVSIVGGAAVVDVGGASGSPVQAQLSSHGSATGDEVQLLDGLRIGNMMGGSRTNVSLAPLIYEQVDVQISGQGGDSTTIGVTSNAVPRSGGNTFAGTFLANGSNSNLQSDNLTDRLKATGLTATSSLKNMFDINGAHRRADREGPAVVLLDRPLSDQHELHRGPVLPGRSEGVHPRRRQVAAGLRQPVRLGHHVAVHGRGHVEDARERLLRHPAQVVAALDHYGGHVAGIRREWWTGRRACIREASPTSRLTGCFSRPATTTAPARTRSSPEHGEITGGQGVYRVVETGGTYQGQPVAPITYGPFGLSIYDVPQHQNSVRASMSYVTGSHQLKVGTDFQTGVRGRVNTNFADDIQLRTTGFVLNQVTIYAPSGAYQTNLDLNGGVYVQDRWTRNRMTLSGALRYDVQKESYDAYTAGPTQVPAQPEPVVSRRRRSSTGRKSTRAGASRTISSATARRPSRRVSREASRRNRSRRPTR